jgi:hypothetical protein
MKALTVQQPWAWAIVHGGKDVENRTQAWGYRGPLAIHAGQRFSERGRESPLVVRAVGDAMRRDAAADFVYGAIIGVVDLVDAHPWYDCIDAGDDMCSAWAETSYAEHGGRTRRDIVHLVLANPRPLAEPVPCRGALGLWTVPPGVDDQIRLQLPLDVTGELD